MLTAQVPPRAEDKHEGAEDDSKPNRTDDAAGKRCIA
ncbi:hypothetical protein FRIGORI9N_60018 [Frigoribacterium sp. 9N]|nr:hypothetical protein FRIGORI9N_60018 [Frigoribacterium sp. 9N]